MRGKRIMAIIPSFAECYLSTPLFAAYQKLYNYFHLNSSKELI